LHAGGRIDGERDDSLPLFADASQQLCEYFAGERRKFDLPLKQEGTPFQQCVWQALERIPFGVSKSYAEIAAEIGQPTASRAVGNANGRNRLMLLVPCHRVIASGGGLGGYAGGLWRKEWLLKHEGAEVISSRRQRA